MNAGTVSVEITADMAKLDAGLNAARSSAVKAGEQTGSAFSQQFTKTWGDQSKALIGQFIGPMMAAQAAKAISSYLRSDKSTPEALRDALTQIPFVGAFVDLGAAIYDATFGAADKAAADLVAKQDAARASVLSARGMAAAEEARAGAAADVLRLELQRMELERDLQATRSAGDDASIVKAETALKLRQMQLDLELAIGKGITDVELNALLKLNAEKRRVLAVEEADKLRAIETRTAKEAEAAAKTAQAERDRIAERERTAEDGLRIARDELAIQTATSRGDMDAARELTEERERQSRIVARDKALRDAATETERRAIRERFDIEEQTNELRQRAEAAAQRAANATGTAQTALGAFTFDAYPDTDKRRNDERLVKATETMANRLELQGIF